MAPRDRHRRILPFRIPFFRIFYSTTYTFLYALTLGILAITPANIIWTASDSSAYQYIFMIGGVYVLTASTVLFIYTSRIYTNRTVLAAVGKAYVPIEEGEVGRSVRKMIVRQLERSAMVAWEGRPRDLYGEIYAAQAEGVLAGDDAEPDGHHRYTVGKTIRVDPSRPPWGVVQHAGWSSPSQRDGNVYPDVRFADVVAEMPNLLEARAVSLATDPDGVMDSGVAEVLKRPETMGMRDYATQLTLLGVVDPDIGQHFLTLYEHARFCGRPVTEQEFAGLMDAFSEIMGRMTELDSAILEEIQVQTGEREDTEGEKIVDAGFESMPESIRHSRRSPAPAYSPAASARSQVTANGGRPSPAVKNDAASEISVNSVVHQADLGYAPDESVESLAQTAASTTAASVARHRPDE